MDILNQAKGVLPNITAQGIYNFIFWLLAFFLFLIIIGGLFGLWLWWYFNKKRFNITIQKFEKINGTFTPIGKEMAMERKIGKSGDTVFYWRNTKTVRPRGSIQTGDKTYWYAKRDDGEWENFGIEDIDFVLKQMKVKYTPVELRYAKESLRDMVKEIYSPEKWWQKWQGVIVSIVFIVLVSIMLIMLTVKLSAVIGSVNTVIKDIPPILEKLDQILGALDNVCSNSGIVR
jgi:hypothetical protein